MELPVLRFFEEHHFQDTKNHSISFLSPYDNLQEIVKNNSFQIINGLDVSGHSTNIQYETPQFKRGKKEVLSKKTLSPGTDGFIFHGVNSSHHNAALLVLTADCAPITFSSKDGDMIGVVHIGWKGLIGGIVENFTKQIDALGYRSEDVSLWIGPMAGDGFEFSENDFKEKIEAFIQRNSIHPEMNLQKIGDEKISFNFRSLVINTLLKSGFREENIIFSQKNTLAPEEIIPSWRKGRQKERMTTMIYSHR